MDWFKPRHLRLDERNSTSHQSDGHKSSTAPG